MTDKQFVGVIIGFVATARSSIAATLIALLVNKSRLTDVKETLRAESKADMSALREGILTRWHLTNWISFPESLSWITGSLA